MLEKPDIQDASIINCLSDAYGLRIAQLDFLPLGADQGTAVYRAVGDDAAVYFVKLRRGDFNDMTIRVPRLLHDQGVRQVIAPIPTLAGQLWTVVDEFKLAVFPFADGHNGYETDLLDHHWIEFGRALKAIHTALIPPAVLRRIQRETYSARWRQEVRQILAQVEGTIFQDPVAAELAAFLKRQQAAVSALVERAEALAAVLQAHSQQLILCHGDIHAGNILIDADDHFYIVDWDTLILAPKERDLMFVGGGLFMNRRSPEQEEALFYQGYGQTQVDPVALAYYRYERIVQDIAAFSSQILLNDDGGQDRANGLRLLMGQFEPGQVIDIAYRSEKHLPPDLRSSV